MDMEKIEIETFNNTDSWNSPDPPPSYMSATGNSSFQTQDCSAISQNAPVPFQSPGFQANTPASCQWYMGPPGIGLHLLDGVEEVIVERVVDAMEVMAGLKASQMKRQIRVLNKDGQQLLFLEEDESFLSAEVLRSYHFRVKDSYGQIIFEVHHDAESCGCGACCACIKDCRSEAQILDPTSGPFGFLKQRLHPMSVRFALEDSNSREFMTISGANLLCQDPTSYELEMTDGSSKGFITKQGASSGGVYNKFSLHFPLNVNALIKACCIGIVVHFDTRFHYVTNRRRTN